MKNKHVDITKVTQNNLCFSCGACEIVCHADCIDFSISNGGKLLPNIDYEKCTGCEVCYKVCPGIDIKNLNSSDGDLFEGECTKSYIGKSLNKEIYTNAQSGGMVTEVLSYMFDANLIKYAVVVQANHEKYPMPSAVLVSSKDELHKTQKSIYVPVNILKVFENIKEIDGDIAVVGTGCQIQGIEELKKYKPKIYNKIKYKLGLICDRTISYLSNEVFKCNDEYKIIYRDKNNPNYLESNVVLECKNNKKIIIDRKIRFWLKDLITPSRCYICADKMNLNADFVFGDPWGIEGYDKKYGESIVIARNADADNIIKNLIQDTRAKLEEINYQNILNGQNIEDRKKRVYQSLAIYKKYNFEIPDYYKKIELPAKIDKKLEKEILRNFKMEKRNYTFNIYYINYILFYRQSILKIKQIIKKILRIFK